MLLAGHMQNELSSLHKVFAWCLHGEPPENSSAVQALANGVQAQIYARLLAGKLLEAWSALGPSFFGAKISECLESKLPSQSQVALKEIKAYFSRPNNIFKVRNSFAFHYSIEQFEANWEEPASHQAFEFILGGTVGNNIALASELVVNSALLNSINPSDQSQALQAFLDEVQSIAESFTLFLEGAIVTILEDAAKSRVVDLGYDENILPQVFFEDIAIPHFYNYHSAD